MNALIGALALVAAMQDTDFRIAGGGAEGLLIVDAASISEPEPGIRQAWTYTVTPEDGDAPFAWAVTLEDFDCSAPRLAARVLAAQYFGESDEVLLATHEPEEWAILFPTAARHAVGEFVCGRRDVPASELSRAEWEVLRPVIRRIMAGATDE